MSDGPTVLENKSSKKTKNSWFIYAVAVALWVGYAILTFSQSTKQSADSPIHFTDTQLLILRLTFILPYLVVWLAAVHGAKRFRLYSMAIGDGDQKSSFLTITKGLYWFVVSIISSTLIGTLRQFFPQGHPAHVAVTILVNYAYIFLPLIAFAYLFVGCRRLLAVTKGPRPTIGLFLVSVVLIAVSVAFVWLILTNPHRLIPSGPESPATYYLPDALIMLTIIAPAILSWFLGAISALYLSVYIRRSTAVIYEKTLPYLSRGIIGLVGASIVLQFLLSLGSDRLLGLGIGALLAIIYVFLIIQGGAYVLIAVAADRLSRLQSILEKYEKDGSSAVKSA